MEKHESQRFEIALCISMIGGHQAFGQFSPKHCQRSGNCAGPAAVHSKNDYDIGRADRTASQAKNGKMLEVT